MSRHRSIRIGKSSFLIDTKATAIITGLTIGMILLMIISLGIGQLQVWPIDVVKAVFGAGTDIQNLTVQQFRAPRIVLSVFAGAALAMSGAILQGIIRNPLASPDIIGITSGAALATVSFLAVYSDRGNALTVSIHWMPLASLIGAIVMGILVYSLAITRNGVQPLKLVLIGIGLAAALEAITTMLMLMGPIFTAARANIWLTGSVNGTNWTEIQTIVPWVLGLTLILFILTPRLNIQELGDELAKNAGAFVQRDRLILLFVSTALAGGAVAFAGGISFVGLMAPHMARRLVGSAFGSLIPTAALIGGIIVLIADLVARTAFAPLEVPVGVFTALIGAPYFIYLLFKSKK